MRNLAFTSDSPRSIKLGDFNDTLSLIVTESDQPIDLSYVSSIVVKIGNTSGFLTEINVAVSSLPHPTDGRIDVAIDSKISSELPPGRCLLEVWIKDAQGNTAIYPDASYPSVIGFTVKKNIMTATSTVITTLTLADFEAKFDEMQKDLQNKVASGYFKGDKGDKGDTGTVDNTGLINSQAFQSLQTQVNNSAVGTNLLNYSSSSEVTYWTQMPGTYAQMYGHYSRTDSYEQLTAPSSGEFYYQFMNSNASNLYGLTPGETYTLSGSASHTAGELKFRAYYCIESNWLWKDLGDPSDLGIPVSDGSVFTPFSHTFTIPVGATGIYFRLQNYDFTAGSLFRFKNMKLEKGSKATDWCPNPSEFLTKFDYYKIQAAIVALGGTL